MKKKKKIVKWDFHYFSFLPLSLSRRALKHAPFCNGEIFVLYAKKFVRKNRSALPLARSPQKIVEKRETFFFAPFSLVSFSLSFSVMLSQYMTLCWTPALWKHRLGFRMKIHEAKVILSFIRTEEHVRKEKREEAKGKKSWDVCLFYVRDFWLLRDGIFESDCNHLSGWTVRE